MLKLAEGARLASVYADQMNHVNQMNGTNLEYTELCSHIRPQLHLEVAKSQSVMKPASHVGAFEWRSLRDEGMKCF